MGSIDGFLKFDRKLPEKEAPEKRVEDSREFITELSEEENHQQAARCMDCGIPFCHKGCPLGNKIPDFNEAVYNGDWKRAFDVLSETNNFPEFTGRICPAPCEASCVLSINSDPVAIEHIEKTIAEKAFDLGYQKPKRITNRTGKRVAVVGSGPAGLAAADQLNQAGHWVTVFERDSRPGGLLTYGIPDFKMEKWVVERRVKLMEKEGVEFQCDVNIGEDKTSDELLEDYDALLVTVGCLVHRELPIQGRNLEGIHFAMDYLTQQNKRIAKEAFNNKEQIVAEDKHVVVIGGGDTGSDCVGTANRQKAKSVTQLQYHDKPPHERSEINPWPEWPMTLMTSSSHEEGCERQWAVLTKAFISDETGHVKGLKIVELEWTEGEGKSIFKEVKGSEKTIPCDLALIAIGFSNPNKQGPIEELNLELSERGTVKTENYQSSVPKVFAAGDARIGQSLVVNAISEGREAAVAIDKFLTGHTTLKSKYRAVSVME